MKNILPVVIATILLMSACKKETKTPEKQTNVEIILNTTSTYNIKIVQRDNATLTYYTPVDKTNVTGNFDYKLIGGSKDLLQVTIDNTGAQPVHYQVLYNNGILFTEDFAGEHFNGTFDTYIP